jgi:hypothetical protein
MYRRSLAQDAIVAARYFQLNDRIRSATVHREDIHKTTTNRGFDTGDSILFIKPQTTFDHVEVFREKIAEVGFICKCTRVELVLCVLNRLDGFRLTPNGAPGGSQGIWVTSRGV